MSATALMNDVDISDDLERDRLDDELYEVVDGQRIEKPLMSAYSVKVGSRLLAEESLQKTREYFEAGVRLVWVVYPEQRLVYVYDSPTQIRVLTTDDTLDGGTMLPGFQLRLDRLFDPIAPPTGGA